MKKINAKNLLDLNNEEIRQVGAGKCNYICFGKCSALCYLHPAGISDELLGADSGWLKMCIDECHIKCNCPH